MPKPSSIIAALVVLVPVEARGQTPARSPSVTVPAPVSGRSPKSPNAILNADALARVELIRDNLELIRLYTGRPKPPPPLLRVEGAHVREVLYQSLNLFRRVQQLSFEHLRTPIAPIEPAEKPPTPADVFDWLNRSLLPVLEVKQALGIAEAVPERLQPDSTTPSEVFNAIVEVGQIVNSLLDSKTTDTDLFSGVTMAVQVAQSLHSQRTRKFLPKAPPFEPNKTPEDVYQALYRCIETTWTFAGTVDEGMLRFQLSSIPSRSVTPDDATELIALLIAELIYLHIKVLGKQPDIRPYQPTRRYPSDVVQRTRFLDALLSDLIRAKPRRSRSP